jgi:hypothetical protein
MTLLSLRSSTLPPTFSLVELPSTTGNKHKLTCTQSHKNLGEKCIPGGPKLKKSSQEAGSVSHICISSFNYYRSRKNFTTHHIIAFDGQFTGIEYALSGYVTV